MAAGSRTKQMQMPAHAGWKSKQLRISHAGVAIVASKRL
jgi:hypothetical protein